MSDLEELRSEWESKKTWSTGTFDSLERFVKNSDREQIEKFIETEDVEDLFPNRTGPKPRPSQSHVEYMVEFAKGYLNT